MINYLDNFQISLIFICCFIISCGSKKSNEISATSIYDYERGSCDTLLISIEGHYDVSEVIDTVTFVHLQTKNNDLIGNVDKLLPYGDHFFVLDMNMSKSLYCFNINGMEKFRISSIGKGEGEYIIPADFDVKDSIVSIFDREQRKIINYDFNGIYLNENSLAVNAPLISFARIDSTNFLFATHNTGSMDQGINYSHNLLTIGSEEEIISYDLPYERGRDLIMIPELSVVRRVNNKEIQVLAPWENSIYYLKNNMLLKKYFFDFGQFGIKEEMFGWSDNDYYQNFRQKLDASKELSELVNEEQLLHGPYSFAESNRYIWFDIKKGSRRIACFYSKNSKKIVSSSSYNVDMGLCFAIPLINSKAIVGDSIFMGSISPFDLLEGYENLKKGSDQFNETLKACPQYNRLIESIERNDNPMITLVKLNHF